MKNLLLLAILTCSTIGVGQVETSLRWVGIGATGGLNFFFDDSTDLVTIDCDYHTGYALFTDPTDSLLYGLFRGTGEDYGNNNLYIVNPFSGAIDLVTDFSGISFTSADINTDGSVIYTIVGEGTDFAKIFAYDTDSGTETLLSTAIATPGTNTFGMEYHPLDDQLYIYIGAEIGDTELQQIDVNTLTNIQSPLIGFDGFITGAKWTGNDYGYIVSTSYDCDFLITGDDPNEVSPFYSSCMPETADIAEIHTIYAEGDSIAICTDLGETTTLELMYDVNSFAWYKDGVLLATETDPTLTVSEPGVYQAALEIKTTTAMLFSKEIVVYEEPDCVVSTSKNERNTIKLFPNPIQDKLHITATEFIKTISVYDLNGKRILHLPTAQSNTIQLNTTPLENGVYLVEITTESGIYHEKIVK